MIPPKDVCNQLQESHLEDSRESVGNGMGTTNESPTPALEQLWEAANSVVSIDPAVAALGAALALLSPEQRRALTALLNAQ